MTQETFEQMVERIGIELNGGYQPSPIELRATVEFATRLRDELANGQTPFAWHHPEEGLNYENHYVGNIPLYTHPFVAAPAGVPDFEPDAKRLALELECLLLDCKDMAAVSKWWDSAHEALEQHRAMLSAAHAAPDHISQPVKMVEPFGYFKAEPFGWTDCSEEDEGAIPLYDKKTVDELVSAPADAVAKHAEAEYAIKESRRINSCEEYFGARPQIDCLDRRRVFEAGFDRGYDAAMQGKESGNV